MSESGPRMAQRVLWLTAGGGGEGLCDADQRFVLRIFAGSRVGQLRKHRLGHSDVTAQGGQPAALHDEMLDVG